MLNVGIIGLGFMGATHLAAWRAARASGVACEVVAVADADAKRRSGDLHDVGGNLASAGGGPAFDPRDVRTYEHALDLIHDDTVDAVSVCTWTPTHVELAAAAMRAGKDVLVEKPVALNVEDVERLMAVEAETGRVCMPAMCMRFWPAWTWLKQRIDSGSFGRVRSATFSRLAERPRWSSQYESGAATGGALFDLHIHDADFVHHCFGAPAAVTSAGRIGADGSVDHVTTLYRFGDHSDASPTAGHVVAEGGYDHHAGFADRMRYVVNFDEGTADFDLTRQTPLLLCRNGRAEVVEVEPLLGYDHEVRHFATALLRGRRPSVVTLADALAVTRMLDAERRSLRSGETVSLRRTPAERPASALTPSVGGVP